MSETQKSSESNTSDWQKKRCRIREINQKQSDIS